MSEKLNGLLVCAGVGKYKNIGDYIQSVASEQFFDHIDTYVERENLNNFKSEKKTKLIMNGWFMWSPQNWPPSNDIDPLFVSFHIVPTIANIMLSNEGIDYLKKYEPIGCRDLGTVEILKSKGIEAYFSGCLTITLDKEDNRNVKDEVIFVDPYFEGIINKKGKKSKILILSNLIYGIFHCNKIIKIKEKFKVFPDSRGKNKIKCKIRSFVNASSFYRAYSKKFADELLFGATYLTHSVAQSEFKDEESKLNYSKKLIKKYSNAKMIVTSRIHCALPCLGIETPVIFITSNNLELKDGKPRRSPGRFEGNIELFRTGIFYRNGIVFEDDFLNNNGEKINIDFSFTNKTNYIQYRDELIKKCKEFVATE